MLIHHTNLFKNTDIDTSSITIKQYPTNYTIALEGSICQMLYIVLEGTIGITSYSSSGNSIHLQTLNPGMIVGDVLLFGSSDHLFPGNMITVTSCTIASITKEQVTTFVHESEEFRMNLIHSIAHKAYHSSIDTKLLSQDSLRDKILYFLTLEMTRQNSTKIQLNMTKEELANKLNVKRPSLSRELAQMKQEGLIDYNKWTITKKDSMK